ncbi:hypothetical protein [Pelagibacterium lentulum]|uniref:CheA signal transduction histidine kinase n=1 Tax=Pelagibacterium lentulum TaxID=2029865 RepID=A0A916RHV6_9HYPH|nr:hypothetical protein [Pelagibacterium lentulum]GGA57716.1 hypothetical protein GCM10011499_29920 [Pelagibacterium lentulum]
MADYRELLRKAIDALPDNTGANRRAVYEKARSALVAQLRAVEPPLPAREITQHRLNLEDCIRQVEQEATDRLLGRLKQAEEHVEAEEQEVEPAPVQPEPEAAPEAEQPRIDEPAEDFEQEPVLEDAPPAADEPELATEETVDEAAAEPEPEPDFEPVADASPDQETSDDVFAVSPQSDQPIEPDFGNDAEPEQSSETPEPAFEEPVIDEEPGTAVDEAEKDAASGAIPLFGETDSFPLQDNDVQSADADPVFDPSGETQAPAPGSIEDIIAQAQREATAASEGARLDNVVALDPKADRTEQSPQHASAGLIISSADAAPRPMSPLVDIHGKPLSSHAHDEPATEDRFGEAMSSVREVDVEPQAPQDYMANADPQIAIDRAIAALDREARGEASEDIAPATDETAQPAGTLDPFSTGTQPANASDETVEPATEDRSGGGFSAVTVFLLIAVLLLAGGGIGGYFAWREGYIDLDTVFAQSDPAQQVAELSDDPEPQEPATEEPSTPVEGVNGAAMSGEEMPFVEPDGAAELGPEDRLPADEDRLPSDNGVATNGEPAPGDDPAAEVATTGIQSLLLEEQASGAAGAVPYSGSVEWSRGTDELGHPTIIGSATIPARNLDVRVLLRRNADTNLPASHLMEVTFNVAESFVGGSIANLPGVLLKDEELVQGQPLTGASARIVGNSFLFALSSASPQDVVANENLLRNREWLDLAMVYGTGRRAIMTLEKGDEGNAIFTDVMDAWSALDAESQPDEAAAE